MASAPAGCPAPGVPQLQPWLLPWACGCQGSSAPWQQDGSLSLWTRSWVDEEAYSNGAMARVPANDRGAETSPSSPGIPGGEPEPAHPQQQRLGAVSDPLPAVCIVSLVWCCGSWGTGMLWEVALVLACAELSCAQS